MGATEFTTEVIRARTMPDAYRAAVNAAWDEFGHDGYNGTISTTDGARQITFVPMTQAAAYLRANAAENEAQKWGNALAIPVAEDKDFVFTKVTTAVELPTGADSRVSEWDLRDAAQKRAFTSYGQMVHAVEVIPTIRKKTVVESPKGRSVTRYQVVASYGRGELFDTRAQAVAAAKKSIKNHSCDVRIRAVRYWPESNTTDAVVVKEVTTAATAKVVITIAQPKDHCAPVGWMFYGMAAC